MTDDSPSPPQASQYKSGTSGNPRGRPRGRKDLAAILMDAANDEVVAVVDGQRRRISKLQATAVQLADKAVAGDRGAMLKFIDWIDEIEARAEKARPKEFPFSAADVEVLRIVYERMMQCLPPDKNGGEREPSTATPPALRATSPSLRSGEEP